MKFTVEPVVNPRITCEYEYLSLAGYNYRTIIYPEAEMLSRLGF